LGRPERAGRLRAEAQALVTQLNRT
jgi:hypothetical protein